MEPNNIECPISNPSETDRLVKQTQDNFMSLVLSPNNSTRGNVSKTIMRGGGEEALSVFTSLLEKTKLNHVEIVAGILLAILKINGEKSQNISSFDEYLDWIENNHIKPGEIVEQNTVEPDAGQPDDGEQNTGEQCGESLANDVVTTIERIKNDVNKSLEILNEKERQGVSGGAKHNDTIKQIDTKIMNALGEIGLTFVIGPVSILAYEGISAIGGLLFNTLGLLGLSIGYAGVLGVMASVVVKSGALFVINGIIHTAGSICGLDDSNIPALNFNIEHLMAKNPVGRALGFVKKGPVFNVVSVQENNEKIWGRKRFGGKQKTNKNKSKKSRKPKRRASHKKR